MSFTGRPSSPPAALTSSSQIFIATSDILPLAASEPVSDMLKPILIGSPLWASAATADSATAAVPPAMLFASRRQLSNPLIVSSLLVSGCLSAPDFIGQLHHHAELRPLFVLGDDIAFLAR